MEKLPNFHACFVCGDRNSSGLGVRFVTDGKSVRAHFTPQESHMGYHGHVHGGILASILDETMGWAPVILNKRFCVTIELSVEYLKSVPIGTEVIVKSRAAGSRGRIWEAEGEIVDAEGTTYARGRGRYMAITAAKTRDVLSYLTFDDGCISPESLLQTDDTGIQ